MCSVCYGIGDCPVCGDNKPDYDDFDEILNEQLDAADNYNKQQKEEQI